LNAHRAALGASLMSQEQKKNTPQSILNAHRADLIHIEYPLSVFKKKLIILIRFGAEA
jgi:hypothetical protein